MLVLTRKTGEKLVIGGKAVLAVTAITGTRVTWDLQGQATTPASQQGRKAATPTPGRTARPG